MHDLAANPWPSRRSPICSPHGMVATSHPLAAEAGLARLRAGGNAIDAALATAIALTVLEPTSNGIGGDCFAIVWDGTDLHGLHSCGQSAQAASIDALHALGHHSIPRFGWPAVTVPGAPRGWAALHQRFGSGNFADCFSAAIDYAAQGFPVSPLTARGWQRAAAIHTQVTDPACAAWPSTFLREGQAPVAGGWYRNPAQAESLRELAESMCESLYTGDLADKLTLHARATGGWLTLEDLAAHQASWEPVGQESVGPYELVELGPPTQGYVALLAAAICQALEVEPDPDNPRTWHQQIEALKLSFAHLLPHWADPAFMQRDPVELIAPEVAAELAGLINDTASDPTSKIPGAGGTVYLCTADAAGRMVSFIQSNYQGFGSGVVIPGTGIALHNRGLGFSLDPAHPNAFRPRKRPFHTIIPGFLMQGAIPLGPVGVMGGHMQPQGHLQVALKTAWGIQPQAALDAPRFRWESGRILALEQSVPPEIAADLTGRGHDLQFEPVGVSFGRGQCIWRLPEGGYVAGSDPRADGQAVGY